MIHFNMWTVSSDVSTQRRHWQPLSVHLWAYCTHPTHDVNDVMSEGWPQHRGLRPLLFSNSGVGSFTSHKNKSVKVLWDGTYDFSSLSEKTRKSNRLQMWLQRQHFLLSYLKTLSVGPIAFSPADSKCQAFVKRTSTGNRLLMTSLTHAHPRKGRRGTSKTRLDIKTSYSGFQISERSQCMITLPWLQSATKWLRHCT